MNKLERELKKLDKLKAKQRQHEENIQKAEAIIKEAEVEEMKSLKYYVGSAYITALQNAKIEPDDLIKITEIYGDKRKNYTGLIRSLHNSKPPENPVVQ